LILVADAPPVIVLVDPVVVITCLQSIYTVVLAPIAVAVWIAVPSIANVNVPAEAAVLVTAMLVTIVVAVKAVVYSVVAVLVAAAPRYSSFEVVAISYYTFPLLVY
jgi:hypothetical protein